MQTLDPRTEYEVRTSPCAHLASCVPIVDELQRETWGALPNVLQQRIEAAVRWCKEHEQPARIIVLKARRSGCSTICAKIVDLECRNQVTRALQIGDTYARTDEVFRMTAHFAERDVFPWKARGATAAGRKLTYGNGSEVEKATAGDRNAGRGGQRRVIHATEVAHYRSAGVLDGGRMLLGLLPSVAKVGGTIVLAESTANGEVGWYYETWTSARWPEWDDYWRRWDADPGGSGDALGNQWIRVFAAWFEEPRYAKGDLTATQRESIEATLTARERAGREKYGWTTEQIAWRRVTVATDCAGSEDLFDQEYPEDPKSAFLLSGSPAFAREALDAHEATAAAAAGQWLFGVLEAQGTERRANVVFRQTPKEEAWVQVIEMPKPDCYYGVVIDPTTGREVAADARARSEPDRDSIGVLRRGYVDDEGRTFPMRLVARVVPPTRVAAATATYTLDLLSRWYGGAVVIPEANCGDAIIERCRELGVPLYQRTGPVDRLTGHVTRALGWETTMDSRRQLVATIQERVHRVLNPDQGGTDGILIECQHAVGELRTFVRRKDGRYEHAPGQHDDDVFMLAIGAQTVQAFTRYREPVRRRRRGGA